MQATGTVDRETDIEFTALEGSLAMMSKGNAFLQSLHYHACQRFTLNHLVLNDVLDLYVFTRNYQRHIAIFIHSAF